jgi:GH24 family phage-related lysozyme (muramidase)
MTITPDILDRTKRFEGDVQFMYLDSLGFVTVGVGHLLATVDDAQNVSFVVRADGTSATPDQIAADYAAVKAMPANLDSSKYKSATQLALAQGVDDALLTVDLGKAEDQLRSAFANYDGFPAPVQAALIDMMYNMGPGHFNAAKWPRLFAAINAGDWATAAAQCDRPQVSPARNAEVAALFQQAATVAAPQSA